MVTATLIDRESLPTNDMAEHFSVLIPQKITAGPSGFLDRQVTLMLSKEEALTLAMKIIGALPALWLGEVADCEALKRNVAMIGSLRGRKVEANVI